MEGYSDDFVYYSWFGAIGVFTVMNISLDYDETYTRDPEAWDQFIGLIKFGYKGTQGSEG